MKSSDGTFLEKKCKWNAYVIKHPAYDVAMILTLTVTVSVFIFHKC